MSQQTIESILTRAMSDATFAEALFANPDSALTGFDLTAEEVASLRSMSRAEFENASPEQRLSMIKVCTRTDGTCTESNHNETML